MPEVDIDQYLAECLRIEPTVIEEEYVRLPGDLAYWNARYSVAYQRWLQAKLERETTEARLSESWRGQLGTKPGRVTVGEVEAKVVQDPLYTQARQAENDAESEKVRLWGVMDALRTKKEMLVSLGAHMRLEM